MSKYSDNMPTSLRGAIEWLYDDIKEGSTVLDFGCSTGYFGEYLKKSKNCRVFGIEISDDVKKAEKVLDGVYSFDLDGEWPKAVFERTYDALFFGDVIEHLKYPEETLKKSKRLLSKNGKIFISTPNIAHISTRLELLGGNFEYEKMGILDSTHLKYFTQHSLGKLADDSGYKMLRIDSSTNDYPRGVVEKLLKKYGLKANDKFWKMINKNDARAYQYKIILAPKTEEDTTDEAKNVPKPLQKPEQFRNDFIEDLKSQIKQIKQHADDQSRIIEHWKTEAENLQKAQNRNSKVLRKLKEKVKKLKNNH